MVGIQTCQVSLTERVELVRPGRSAFAQAEEAMGELFSIPYREEGLLRGYGRARRIQIAQRMAITVSQVLPLLLHKPHC